jgi:N-acetyl-anhydromuramyl-L-alanine amidase AmpD
MNTIGIEIVSTGGVGGITLRQQTTVKNLVNYLIAEYGLDPETSIISHSCIVSEPLASVYEPLGFQAVSTWGWNIKKSGNKNCPYQTSAEVPQTPTDQQKPEFVVPYECVLNDGIKQYSYTRNPQNIKYIVLHSLENSNYQQAIIYLANNQMSAHYLIDREGTTYLCIPPDTYSAWHAGCISDDPSCLIPEIDQSSIGVVLLKGDGYTTKQKDSLNNLINSLVSKYGIDPNSNIIGHGCVSSADYVAIDEPVSFEPASESGWKLMKRNTGGCPK